MLAPSIIAADKFTPKDTSIDDWCELLDGAIRAVENPATVWKALRHKLLDEGTTPFELARLEDTLVRSLLKKPSMTTMKLNEKASQLTLSENARAIIASFLGSALFASF